VKELGEKCGNIKKTLEVEAGEGGRKWMREGRPRLVVGLSGRGSNTRKIGAFLINVASLRVSHSLLLIRIRPGPSVVYGPDNPDNQHQTNN
jgi:hypothetical protein